jgi:oligopeptide/dipeptide ABC transporter ATP-binding protein
MIIITHNLGVVARYAHRVVVMYAGKIIESGSAEDIYHNPRHAYTLGLLNSVPRLDEARKVKLDPIEGLPPDLVDLPMGCSFAPRCKYVIDKCTQETPSLAEVGNAHYSACIRAAELTELATAAS